MSIGKDGQTKKAGSRITTAFVLSG